LTFAKNDVNMALALEQMVIGLAPARSLGVELLVLRHCLIAPMNVRTMDLATRELVYANMDLTVLIVDPKDS
jgi:hypothetical protein